MRSKLLLLLLIGFLTSCFENSFLEEIPEVNLKDNFSLRRIVHTDISMGTSFNDSLVTSGRSSLLLGNYSDENRGNIKAIPYFEFSLTSTTVRFDEEEELDSLVFILRIQGTHYDTMPAFNLKIWEIIEPFEYRNEDNVFYQFENFSTGREPITIKKIQVYPSQDSIRISLPWDFGNDLFQKAKGTASILATDDDFKDELKGFKLEVEGISPLIQVSKDSNLIFYYQDRNETNRISEEYSIKIGTISKAFTFLKTDHSNTVFKNATPNVLIPSTKTNGLTLIDELGMGGTKLNINGLTEYAEQATGYYIADANLFLPVKRNTYSSNFNPPATDLDVYLRTEKDRFQSYVSQSSLSSLDYLYQEATYFRIPVTEFIDSQIRGESPNTGLWLEIMPDSILTSSYLILGENSTLHKTRLEITLILLK